MKANFWVIAHGLDCDGYNDGHIYSFGTNTEADKFADSSNECSDGLLYEVVDSVNELMRYCINYGKDFNKYL